MRHLLVDRVVLGNEHDLVPPRFRLGDDQLGIGSRTAHGLAAAQDVDDAFQELRLANRFRQVRLETQVHGLETESWSVKGRQQHELRVADGRIAQNLLRQLDAIGVRHHEIDDGDLVRRAVDVGLPERLERVPGGNRDTVLHPPRKNVVTQDGSRVRFVVDNQDPDGAQISPRAENRALRAAFERDPEPERGAAARGAVDADLALHQVDDTLRDAESQACLLYTSDAADERSSVDLG